MVSPNLLKSQIPYVAMGEGGVQSQLLMVSPIIRIFNFKSCVYLAYFRGYGHLKIVKCVGMY